MTTKVNGGTEALLCPSAQPEMLGSIIFGVVGGTVDEPRIGYLTDLQPVTPEVLALAREVKPTEVFRIAAPCANSGCTHFDGVGCRLAERVAQLLPRVTDKLPFCKIRRDCRWWRQEGVAACRRCPQVVTEVYWPTDLQMDVAGSDARQLVRNDETFSIASGCTQRGKQQDRSNGEISW
jgi:hypothetical protein